MQKRVREGPEEEHILLLCPASPRNIRRSQPDNYTTQRTKARKRVVDHASRNLSSQWATKGHEV